MSKQPFKLVLTGGPCASKTQSLKYIQSQFSKLGWNVYIVPETASTFILGGVDLSNNVPRDIFEHAEKEMFKAQMAIEDAFVEIAKNSGKKSLIIFDRGLVDNKAFLSDQMWENLLDSLNLDYFDVTEKRYDAIFHLESAAVKFPEFYTTDNNQARRESLQEAIDLDHKIRMAWLGHPKLRIIPSYFNVNDKLNHLIKEIEHLLSGKEIERKWLIETVEWPEDNDQAIFWIKQNYLKSDEHDELRLRIKSHGADIIRYLITKVKLVDCSKLETEILLDRDEFLNLWDTEKSIGIIEKYRYCFIYENQMFEFDEFKFILNGLKILELELSNFNQEVKLPSWIKIIKEITYDKCYSNKNLSQVNSVLLQMEFYHQKLLLL